MAFDDERSDIQMAVRSLDESNRLFAVEVDMENRSPEEIARDAVMQINALFDRLIKEQHCMKYSSTGQQRDLFIFSPTCI